MDFKKIGTYAIACIMMVVLVFGLTGCNQLTQEDVDAAVSTAVTQANEQNKAALNEAMSEAQANAQKAIDEAKAQAEAAKQAELAKLETEKAQLEEQLAAKQEQERIEQEEIVKDESAYKIDNVGLTEDFAAVIDSDDYNKLKYYSVRFDGDDYDVEEVVELNSDVKPVYNFDEKDAEIFLEVADKNAIEYRVEFPESIDFTDVNEDKDDELEISFLGEDVVITKYEDDEVTFYSGTSKFIQVGQSFTVDDKVVELITIADDKALVKIGEDSAVVYTGNTKVIGDVEVKVSDILNNEEGPGYAKITVALEDDVEYVVKDGDEYEADDRFEYVVEGTDDALEAIGLRLAEEYTDDDEVFAVGEGISFPNDYIKVYFDEVLNAEVEDVTFRLSSDEIDLIYDGIVEFDGKKVEKNSVVFDVASGTALTFEYETKTDKYEDVDVSELSKLVLYNGDREFTIELTDSAISITDGVKEYKFKYVIGSDHEFTDAKKDAAIMDDEDDRLVDNGDVVYSSGVTDADEEEDTVSVGLIDEEDVELVVKVM